VPQPRQKNISGPGNDQKPGPEPAFAQKTADLAPMINASVFQLDFPFFREELQHKQACPLTKFMILPKSQRHDLAAGIALAIDFIENRI